MDTKKNHFAPGLYITATPIGNLADMTLRAIDALKAADVIACEDTRITGRLLAHYDIRTPTVAYHDHNADRMLPVLIEKLSAGQIVAQVSDAGTPLISDPGYRLAKEATQAGIHVSTLPGASALTAALTLAGLPTDRFMFVGFLPAKTQARQKVLATVKAVEGSLVFYESPKRLKDTLADMAAVLGHRQVAVCREITKMFEEVRRGSLSELVDHYRDSPTPKGEIVLVVGPPCAQEATADDLDHALQDALKQLSVKEAVAAVTYITGRKRKHVYARALALKD